MRFFENSMWQSDRLGFEVPDPETKESKASDIYVRGPWVTTYFSIRKKYRFFIWFSWGEKAWGGGGGVRVRVIL